MYAPPHFRVEHRAALIGVIRAHPLSQLVTAGPGGLMANPIPFVAAQMRGAVGVEMKVTRLTGRFKLSQNRPEHDRRGVAAGLEAQVNASAREMAELVRLHGKIG